MWWWQIGCWTTVYGSARPRNVKIWALPGAQQHPCIWIAGGSHLKNWIWSNFYNIQESQSPSQIYMYMYICDRDRYIYFGIRSEKGCGKLYDFTQGNVCMNPGSSAEASNQYQSAKNGAVRLWLILCLYTPSKETLFAMYNSSSWVVFSSLKIKHQLKKVSGTVAGHSCSQGQGHLTAKQCQAMEFALIMKIKQHIPILAWPSNSNCQKWKTRIAVVSQVISRSSAIIWMRDSLFWLTSWSWKNIIYERCILTWCSQKAFWCNAIHNWSWTDHTLLLLQWVKVQSFKGTTLWVDSDTWTSIRYTKWHTD